ncbi:DUF3833 domain-containing protein [Alteromonadaceae bacterium M269]|nr:DUF3833 domain-containing protein [Alteromonadaceae bacterium M269]
MRYLILILILFLTGCTVSVDGDSYRNIEPKFDLEKFFEGNVKAWGIVQNRRGKLVQRFEVDIIGEVNEGELTLDETFTYQVGEGVEKRIWKILPEAGGAYGGTASDIEGNAEGQVFGNAMFWGYEMDLPVDDTTYRVQFDDWIWAFDDKTIVNRSYIKKFGITMAEVTIFMQKQ